MVPSARIPLSQDANRHPRMGHPSVGCDGCRAGDAHDSDGTTGFLLGGVKNAKEGEEAGSAADNTAGSLRLRY
ncbi:TPA: hypothetical protein HA361_04110 [Candidatus Woesearchaeota archaeon]|nr:hypothetical protein [Candidatus Woesearchaeota archaeon]